MRRTLKIAAALIVVSLALAFLAGEILSAPARRSVGPPPSLVDHAAHVDLHAFDPPAYEAKVSAFLNKHLRVQNSSVADMFPLARAATSR